MESNRAQAGAGTLHTPAEISGKNAGKDQRNEPEGSRNARPARAGMVVAL